MLKLNTPEAKQYLDNIRDYVDGILTGKKVKYGIIKCVQDNLGRLTNGKTVFDVDIINLGFKDKPFIMACYPDVDELNAKCSNLIRTLNDGNPVLFKEEWNSFHKWCIEIDGRILDTKNNLICVENGSQFVAILCHELGHVMHTQPMRLVVNYKHKMGQFKMYERVFMDKGMSLHKLFLPMFIAIDGLRVVVNKPGEVVEEFQADFATPDEYKPHMVDYIEHKILTNPMTAHGIVVTREEFNTEQNKGIEFTKECIFLMKKRRDALSTYLNTMHALTHSAYIKKMVTLISKRSMGIDPETGKVDKKRAMYMMESYARDEERALKESVALLEAINVTERDITLLSIEAEGIKNTDDKYYILNTIYDYMEAIEEKYAKAAKKNKPTEAPSLMADRRYKMLQDLRTKVINTKVIDGEHYGVFIKYPKGYEG